MFIDILFILLVLICFYIGYSKGIIKSLFGILSIVLAVLISLKFSFLLIGVINKILNADPRLEIILGFVLCFLLVMISIRLIGRGFEKILESAHINFLNKLAGGLLSAIVAIIIFSYIILFIDKIKLLKASAKETSICYPLIESVPARSQGLIGKTKILFSEFWNKTREAIEEVEKELPQKKEAI